ncbi:MAG TPA: DUF58 domain-containing protein [Anaerolineae bacterium]
MASSLILLTIVLAVLAVILRQDFVLTLCYLLLGAFIIGRGWTRRALNAVAFTRTLSSRHVFVGEKVQVRLDVVNREWLPVIWLQLHDTLPVSMATPPFFTRVVSLGPRGRVGFEYALQSYKRGYYRIGPLTLYSGDVLGLGEEAVRVTAPDSLIVYPKVVPLTWVPLPSQSPMGNLRHTQPIFEDPSRVIGKRDYVAGDSLQRVDWKATAVVGRLQVKQYQPSIALETLIVLNLTPSDYNLRTRSDDSELAIVVAASLANWVTGRKQAVGLITTGKDPLAAGGRSPMLPSRKGRAHLARILEMLARIELAESGPLVDALRRESVRLSWGTTLIVITPQADELLFDGLLQARRAGLNVMLIVCGFGVVSEARRKAQQLGIPVHSITRERDLDMWRR